MRLRLCVMGFVCVAVACGGGSDDNGVGPSPAPASGTVTMSADRFMPDSTTIRVGGTVAFVNQSGVVHDVDFGTLGFRIAAFDAGTRSLTFPTAGTLNYFCNIHAGMEAKLVVR